VVYDAGYQDAHALAGDGGEALGIEFKVAARKSRRRCCRSSISSWVTAGLDPPRSTPFLIVKRDFRFTKTHYRGLAKNRHHLNVLFASANWVMGPGRRSHGAA
jgi:IS5 family transposase